MPDMPAEADLDALRDRVEAAEQDAAEQRIRAEAAEHQLSEAVDALRDVDRYVTDTVRSTLDE